MDHFVPRKLNKPNILFRQSVFKHVSRIHRNKSPTTCTNLVYILPTYPTYLLYAPTYEARNNYKSTALPLPLLYQPTYLQGLDLP